MKKRGWVELPLEKVRSVPILTVASKLGLGKPVRRGREWAVLCPLHDDHNPSCYLNTEEEVWYCHVCKEGGDGIQLVQRARDLPFQEAVLRIAGWTRGLF